MVAPNQSFYSTNEKKEQGAKEKKSPTVNHIKRQATSIISA
jgi:hypothetical protein